MFTDNEKKVLKVILSTNNDKSINDIAKRCNISPNGAYKILKKFESLDLITSKNISNIKSYRINFDNEKTLTYLELCFIDKLEGKIKYRYEDLKPLKESTRICIIFGSYTKSKKDPKDLDLFFIIDKEKFKEYKRKKEDIKIITPAEIHDILQTDEDFKENFLKENIIISEIINKGIILWGQRFFLELIKDVYKIR